jgi:hypothetical protein
MATSGLIYCQDTTIINAFDDDPIFNITEAKPSFQANWGVVLAKKNKFTLNIEGKYDVTTKREYRSRIKIQDKAAVKYFSDFRLPNFTNFSMSIIKPTGRVIKVDTNDAIDVTEGLSIANGSSKLEFKRTRYKKLAIRFLEVGDIIDFSYINERNYDIRKKVSAFYDGGNILRVLAEESHFFGDDFPTQTEVFEIEVSPELYINYRSINGTPDIKTTNLDNGNILYQVATNDLKTFENQLFINPNKNTPLIEYQVIFCRDFRYNRAEYILGDKGVLNETSTYEQIRKSVFLNCQPYRFGRKDPLKEWSNINERDPEKYMRKLYRKLQWEFCKYENKTFSFPSLVYSRIMHTALKNNGFKSEIIVCIPAEYGGIENTMFTSDFIYGVRAKNKDDEYIYSFSFKKCSSFDDWNYRVVGSKAYAFTPEYNYNKFDFTEIKLPEYLSKSNRSDVELKVKLNLEDQITKVNATTFHYGELKTQYAEDLLSPFEMAEDIEFEIVGVSKKEQKQIETRLIEINKQNRLNKLEAWWSSDFELKNYKDFELIQSGMELENDVIQYKEDVIITDLIKKAGSDIYVFEIGRLIGSQIEVPSYQRVREDDVYIDYVKRYQYVIDITVPNGYEFENITDLRFEEINKAGLFTVEINIQPKGFQLIVTKAYSEKELSKEDWPELLKVLDTAADFNNSKLVLVPKNG